MSCSCNFFMLTTVVSALLLYHMCNSLEYRYSICDTLHSSLPYSVACWSLSFILFLQILTGWSLQFLLFDQKFLVVRAIICDVEITPHIAFLQPFIICLLSSTLCLSTLHATTPRPLCACVLVVRSLLIVVGSLAFSNVSSQPFPFFKFL